MILNSKEKTKGLLQLHYQSLWTKLAKINLRGSINIKYFLKIINKLNKMNERDRERPSR